MGSSKEQGLVALLLYTYNLKGIEPIKKQSFTHALYGTGGRKSVLKEIGGYKIGRNSVVIPLEKQRVLDEFFSVWNIKPLKIMIYAKRKAR